MTRRSTSQHAPRPAEASINAVRACLMAAAHAGLDMAEVVELVGVSPEALGDPEARVSAELAFRAWDLVAERLGDPHFGLHAAESIHAMLFDAYDFAVTSAATLREGIEGMVRHLRLQHEGAELRFTVVGREARVAVRFGATSRVPRHFCECCIAVWVLRARGLLATPFVPRRVCFRHDAPRDLSEHRRVIGGDVVFSAGEDAVHFDAELLDLPLRSANPPLRKIMDSYLEERDAPKPGDPIDLRVRAEIERAIAETTPTVGRVASRMGVSVRSLQRALGDAGTTFHDQLDTVRRELALAWARDPARSFKEISNDLGFGRSTAFTRAFRRWTGLAPSAWRAEALGSRRRATSR